jgi:hypothetical protein
MDPLFIDRVVDRSSGTYRMADRRYPPPPNPRPRDSRVDPDSVPPSHDPPGKGIQRFEDMNPRELQLAIAHLVQDTQYETRRLSEVQEGHGARLTILETDVRTITARGMEPKHPYRASIRPLSEYGMAPSKEDSQVIVVPRQGFEKLVKDVNQVNSANKWDQFAGGLSKIVLAVATTAIVIALGLIARAALREARYVDPHVIHHAAESE